MKKNIAMISLTVGLIFALVLRQFSALNPSLDTPLPALATLFVAELGAILSAFAVFVTGKDLQTNGMNLRTLALLIGNVLLVLNFIYMGLQLWSLVSQ